MTMHFDLFVIPFCIGFSFLIVALVYLYTKWMSSLEKDAGKKILKLVFTEKSLDALKEVFMESLIHRKIYKINPVLGYMHMSLAFGWFLLIVFGKFETLYYSGELANEIYYPIFFRFFETAPHQSITLSIFNFVMDLLLLIILSGVFIALVKRFRSGITGIKRTTKHTAGDRLALASLWLIFPLRLLAESFTASYAGNGSFLTQPLGNFLGEILPAHQTAYFLWWGYSFSLGGFMVALPFSRYMHIPTEIFLIFLRNYGFNTKQVYSGFSNFELHSCSRCGLCIDTCQMNSQGGNRTTQMVYFLRDLREGKLTPTLFDNCLMCGRCEEVCPVGISLTSQRLIQRRTPEINNSGNFSYLPSVTEKLSSQVDVIYFAGCMSHLTPAIKKSMVRIFDVAKVNYLFLDENRSICCGRPLKLAGKFEDAKIFVANNRQQIVNSGAKTLVTSCPICYKSFNEDYNLNIRIVHHSEFISELIDKKLIKVRLGLEKVVYHDPCELGRGSNIYNQPRHVIKSVAHLISIPEEKEKSFCCGGSLGNLSIVPTERDNIQRATANYLNNFDVNIIATACPLCKKSIGRYSEKPVKDIAELVANQLSYSNNMHLKVAIVQEECVE
jgi:Fe-S oxidoreductase